MAVVSSSDPQAAPGGPAGKPQQLARQGLTLVRSALALPMASYYLVLGAAGLLVGLGVLMVLSSSSVFAYVQTGDAYYFVKRQVLFLLAGLLAGFVLSRLTVGKLRALGWAGVALAFVLLILTYTPLGVSIAGNRNWLDLGTSVLRVQPSEFAKLAIVVWGADVLARKEKLLDQPKHLIWPYLPVTAMLILLVVFQGDLGTAIVMCGMVAAVLFIVGVPLRIFGGVLALALVMITFLVKSSDERMSRLRAFLNPGTDLLGKNMQATMGIYAIASGGWWGLGLGASRQKWGSLTQAYSDYIFAVTAEELGLFGSLVVLALFLLLGYAGVRVALRSDLTFCRYTAAGVTSWFMIQAVINIAVVLRLVPVMGVPLPLMSYGGSALLANLMALGVLLACARNEPAARELAAARSGARRPTVTTVTTSKHASKRASTSAKPASRRTTR